MAALNHFISKLGERDTEFFKLFIKQDDFRWANKAQTAFDDLKKFLTSPSVLTSPLPGEE